MSHDDIVTADRAKYNNVVASDEYSKLDHRDSKIIALTKKVTALEQSISENLANVTSGGGSGRQNKGNQGAKIEGVDKWRTVNEGTTIQ